MIPPPSVPPPSSRVHVSDPSFTYTPPFPQHHVHTHTYSNRTSELRAISGGGSIGGTGGVGGTGGGGGDAWGGRGDNDDDASKSEFFLVKGWKERMVADPQFAYKVVIEQVIGVSASVIGDMASRPNWGLNELDFVFATLVVGSIVNFALMYLLAPVPAAAAGASTASASLVTKIFGEHFLKGWAAPTGHMFQPGFPVSKRAVNFVYKGAVFSFIGLCSGLVGTAISNSLVTVRKKLDPSFVPNPPPNVLANASCWALHMGLSSNLRYQCLNGLDMILQPIMPLTVFRVFTSAVRGINNAAGGISFVLLAKLLGVQKAAPVVVEEPAGKKGKKKSK